MRKKNIKGALIALISVGTVIGSFLLPAASAYAAEADVNVTLPSDTVMEEEAGLQTEPVDTVAPVVTARLVGEIMYLTATDTDSGVDFIAVNGTAFTNLTDGEMCLNVKDYEQTCEYFVIYARDNAGNRSKISRVKNAYYIGEPESGSEDMSLVNPYSIEKTAATDAKGTVIEDTVNTDEDGVVTKEFYTITADGKTFYLIVDKQQSQDNVFLLTEAGVNDLLNFVNYNGVDVQNGDIPMYELSDASLGDAAAEYLAELNAPKETDAPENGEGTSKNGTADKSVTTGDTNAPAGNKSTIVLVIAIAGVGVVVFLVRSKKRKNDIAEAGDIDEFGGSDDYDDSDDDTDSDN